MAAGIGTMNWIAPGVRGERYTEMADTYSFGVILSELATCIKPFDGVTNALIVLKVTSEWKRKIAMQSWNTIFNAVVEQTSCSTSGAKLVAVSGYKTPERSQPWLATRRDSAVILTRERVVAMFEVLATCEVLVIP
ncbi:Protein kinase-like domain [Phytophthora cactorum]|nr:Protein kinase-like domain [Phytophthora cactorum]